MPAAAGAGAAAAGAAAAGAGAAAAAAACERLHFSCRNFKLVSLNSQTVPCIVDI